MLTIAEIESACVREHGNAQSLDFSRHPLEASALTLRELFHPLGFPIYLHTNSTQILAQARELWSVFTPRFDTPPLRVDVHVEPGGPAECPPTPVFRMMLPLMVNMADTANLSIADLDQATTRIVLAESTLRHFAYTKYFFLGSAPLCHIATRFATPVHAGCVAFNGRGMLLCGDSGAGKSTLSYACARAGFTYVTDDAAFLLHNQTGRTVTGNCHQIRFRPTAAALFREIDGLAITPRAAGKPSIELPTPSLPGLCCADTAQIDFLVFLSRDAAAPQKLLPYRQDVARHFMRQVLYGSAASRAVQHEALETLLTAPVVELRYHSLDWAVQRLQRLASEGLPWSS